MKHAAQFLGNLFYVYYIPAWLCFVNFVVTGLSLVEYKYVYLDKVCAQELGCRKYFLITDFFVIMLLKLKVESTC